MVNGHVLNLTTYGNVYCIVNGRRK